jgi:hypothetical protein
MTELNDLSRRVARIEAALAQPILPAINPPEPPQPPDPPGPVPTTFWALNCIDNDAATNKLVRLPQLRRMRGPRQDVGTLGDIRGDEWHKGEHLEWEDKNSVVPKGYAQWSSNMHRGKLERRGGSYLWRNISVASGLDATQLKWGTREYNAPQRSFIDCDFTEITQEHGMYVSPSAGATLDACTFLRCGSQGVQFAHRPLPYQQYDGDNMPYDESPHFEFTDCHFVDNAFNGTRPSFNLTLFSPGTSQFPGTVLINDCSFVCDWSAPRADMKRSTGGLVVTPSQGNAPLLGQNMMHLVHVYNSLFDFTNGDRALAEIRSADEVVFDCCAFIARDHALPFITIDKDYGNMNDTKTKRIVFKNCRSKGVQLNLLLAADEQGKQASVKHDIHCPDGTLEFDGITGRRIQ